MRENLMKFPSFHSISSQGYANILILIRLRCIRERRPGPPPSSTNAIELRAWSRFRTGRVFFSLSEEEEEGKKFRPERPWPVIERPAAKGGRGGPKPTLSYLARPFSLSAPGVSEEESEEAYCGAARAQASSHEYQMSERGVKGGDGDGDGERGEGRHFGGAVLKNGRV